MDCLPDTQDCPENCGIFVVGPETSLPLDPLSLASWLSSPQRRNWSMQGWQRGEDRRRRLSAGSCLLKSNTSKSKAVMMEKKEGFKSCNRGAHHYHKTQGAGTHIRHQITISTKSYLILWCLKVDPACSSIGRWDWNAFPLYITIQSLKFIHQLN